MSFSEKQPSAAPGAMPGSGGWAVPGVDQPRAEPAHGADTEKKVAGESASGASEPAGTDQEAHTETNDTGVDAESASSSGSGDVAQDLDVLRGSHAGSSLAAHPVLAAVYDCLLALRGIQSVGVSTLGAEELKVLILAVTQIIAQAVALKFRLLVAGETQQVKDTLGATSTATFLAQLTQTVRGTASGEVRLARTLDRRYPVLAEAFAAGLLNPAQVKACVAGLDRLPRNLDPEPLERCQRFLIEAAQTYDALGLKRLGRHLWEVIDPDGADAKTAKALEDEEEQARARAWFTSRRNGDGTTSFRGRLPNLHFDMLEKLIHAYAAPRHHQRTQARADGEASTDSGQPDNGHPDGGAPDSGQPAGGQPDRREHDGGAAGGGQPAAGPPDPPPGAPCEDPSAEESPEERQTGRTLPWPARLGHALMELIEHIPPQAIPYAGGMPATIVVFLDYQQLRDGLGQAILDTGSRISPSQARRMACEAGIIPAVFDGASQPLDLGREQRLFTRYQNLAMIARDLKRNPHGIPGCCVEGCDRPAAWTIGHHKKPWACGGETNLDNGARPCGYHHTLIHHPSWTTTWLPNGEARLRKTGRTRE